MKAMISLKTGIAMLVALPVLAGCYVSGGYDYDHGGWHPRPPHGGYHPAPRPPMPFPPRPPRPHYPPRPHHPRHIISQDLVNMEVDSAQLLAQDYDLRKESAEAILEIASGKDQSKMLDSMGLEMKDLAPALRGEMPSQETIGKIAQGLGEDSAKIEAVLEGFVSDISAESQEN